MEIVCEEVNSFRKCRSPEWKGKINIMLWSWINMRTQAQTRSNNNNISNNDNEDNND